MTTLRRTICSILSLLLASCGLLSAPTPERVVNVKILADPRIRESNVRWRDSVETLFEAASYFYETEFGIRLVAQKILPWPLKEKVTSTAELLGHLKKQAPLTDSDGSYDIIIGVTALPGRISPGHGRVDEIGNCREGLGNYIAISATEPLLRRDLESALANTDAQTLIHELGHIFGAEHVDQGDSIMSVYFKPFSDFDARNREIIRKNKFCPFGKGGARQAAAGNG
jgi:hypothetical protein